MKCFLSYQCRSYNELIKRFLSFLMLFDRNNFKKYVNPLIENQHKNQFEKNLVKIV